MPLQGYPVPLGVEYFYSHGAGQIFYQVAPLGKELYVGPSEDGIVGFTVKTAKGPCQWHLVRGETTAYLLDEYGDALLEDDRILFVEHVLGIAA